MTDLQYAVEKREILKYNRVTIKESWTFVMLELTVKISDVDFDSVAEIMAPFIINELNSRDVPGWVKMMLLGSGMNSEGIKKLMNRFSDDKLESFAVKGINKNSEKACEMLEQMAKGQGVNIKISSVEAKQI